MFAQKVLTIGVISAILSNVTPAIAKPLTSTSSSSLLISQLMNYCEEGESVFLEAETENFWLNICGGDLPHSYVGVSKQTEDYIRLPLSDYDDQGTYFEAINEETGTSYLIIFNTAKGSFLTVSEGEKELFREPLTNW